MNVDVLQLVVWGLVTLTGILYTKGITRRKYRRAIHEELDLLAEAMSTRSNETYTAYCNDTAYRIGLLAALDRLDY